MVLALGYMVQQQMISSQTERNEFLSGEIHKLEDQIKDVSSLKAEIESLKARQRSVEDLQTDRNMPVYLLNELVRQTPEGMYLSSIKQDGQSVFVSGVPRPTSACLNSCATRPTSRSGWSALELQEIKARVLQSKDARDPKRLFDFSVRLNLKRPHGVSCSRQGCVRSGCSSFSTQLSRVCGEALRGEHGDEELEF